MLTSSSTKIWVQFWVALTQNIPSDQPRATTSSNSASTRTRTNPVSVCVVAHRLDIVAGVKLVIVTLDVVASVGVVVVVIVEAEVEELVEEVLAVDMEIPHRQSQREHQALGGPMKSLHQILLLGHLVVIRLGSLNASIA